MMNDLPPPHPPSGINGFNNNVRPNRNLNSNSNSRFKPTTIQRLNAYSKIWGQEMKDTFLFRN